jgi:hypothetical protein
MATSDPQPAATAAQADPATARGCDDRAEQALAHSRELRARSHQLLAKADRIAPAAAAASRARLRAGAGNGPRPGGQQRGPTTDLYEQVEYAKTARARLARLAADLANTEDYVAHVHDQLAIQDPGNAARYQRAADEARQAARRAREFQRTLIDGATGDL